MITKIVLIYIIASPIVIAMTSNMTLVTGSNTTLSFDILDANPVVMSSSITWFFMPTVGLDAGSQVQIVPSEQYIFSSNMLALTILDVELASNEGIYSLRASNVAGSSSSNIAITILHKLDLLSYTIIL